MQTNEYIFLFWIQFLFMNDICVYFTDPSSPDAVCDGLLSACKNKKDVVFTFIGTDANVGDSLAPMCGSLLHGRHKNVFFYGNLNRPITAKEVPFVAEFLKRAHPDSAIIVVDAAVGKKEDVGTVKVISRGIKPGLGVNKNLPPVGDVSVIGVISEKNNLGLSFLGCERVSKVYSMSKVIASGIEKFLSVRSSFLNVSSSAT